MIVTSKNNRPVLLRKLNPGDFDKLVNYFQHLTPETLRRYGPHKFDKQSLIGIYQNSDEFKGYVAVDMETSEIIAYSVIKVGYLEHDSSRLKSYGIIPDPKTDCTFAPSVADEWQSRGIGNSLFHFMLSDLKTYGIKRIILWGGVQSDNTKAVNYYLKNGFSKAGEFEYYGMNFDMTREIES